MRWLGGWRQPAPSFVGVWWFLAVFSVCDSGQLRLRCVRMPPALGNVALQHERVGQALL